MQKYFRPTVTGYKNKEDHKFSVCGLHGAAGLHRDKKMRVASPPGKSPVKIICCEGLIPQSPGILSGDAQPCHNEQKAPHIIEALVTCLAQGKYKKNSAGEAAQPIGEQEDEKRLKREYRKESQKGRAGPQSGKQEWNVMQQIVATPSLLLRVRGQRPRPDHGTLVPSATQWERYYTF